LSDFDRIHFECKKKFILFKTLFNVNVLHLQVAIANVILPVLGEMALVIGRHPMLLMYPAALSCCFAFHMPVGTPPNAIVAGVGNIRTKEMAIAGIGPTIFTLIVVWATFPT
jgi:solute carrier family 13 (sodium-dependent dicarboxylate transporter), member 2/3/5